MIFDRLSSDPGISAGSVVVKGTRVKFQTIAIGVVLGHQTNDQIRDTYGDHFDDASIEQCVTLYKYIQDTLDDFPSTLTERE